MPRRPFGLLADGREVEVLTLRAGGLEARVLTYGAILHALSLPVRGQRRNVVLALPDVPAYERDAAYVGPVVGRFANRIANGRFELDGKAHQLTRNENGNHLHGGARGTGKSLWRVEGSPTDADLALALESPAGEEGYPGTLRMLMQLRLDPHALRVEFSAESDAPTPVNLTWHPYLNLGGEASRHWLRIPASRYLPVAAGLIPTGEIAQVEGTPFDFRAGRQLLAPPGSAHPQLALGGGYDHCWVLDGNADCCCELRSAKDDLRLTIRASGPGVQFYGGQYLSRAHPGLGTGIVLEPQGFPDSPNHPGFAGSVLRPGQVYRSWIEYRLATP